MEDPDRRFMLAAVREARKGIGRTSPNPAVGAVIVRNDTIVGRGFHKRAGTPHAEINALQDAGSKAHGADLYVTLEPCNHTGRTGPCTQAIVAAGIRRVVVGMMDPNPLVTGGGCAWLAGQGVQIVTGVAEDRCRELNGPFIKHITTSLPWVILKAGLSLDGRIATASGNSSWITNELSRQHVHRLRDRVDAILVGSGTAITDDPSLTTRLSGKKGRDPLRVIIDSRLSLPPEARMLRQSSTAATWIFCGPDADPSRRAVLEKAGAKVFPSPLDDQGGVDLLTVLAALGRCQITSVLVEGGSRIHGGFLRRRLVDQVCLFFAPKFLGGNGIPLTDALGIATVDAALTLANIRVRRFGTDVLIEGKF